MAQGSLDLTGKLIVRGQDGAGVLTLPFCEAVTIVGQWTPAGGA